MSRLSSFQTGAGDIARFRPSNHESWRKIKDKVHKKFRLNGVGASDEGGVLKSSMSSADLHKLLLVADNTGGARKRTRTFSGDNCYVAVNPLVAKLAESSAKPSQASLPRSKNSFRKHRRDKSF